MEELVLINKYVTVNTLETYIEKYPEDAQKWKDHLDPVLYPHKYKKRKTTLRVNNRASISQEDYSRYNIIKREGEEFTNSDTMCAICKHSWEQTASHPTTTLLCGHKYHTVCYFMIYYENSEGCIIDGCPSYTGRIISQLHRRRMNLRDTLETTLVNTIKDTNEFKSDLTKMKSKISGIIKHLSAFRKVKQELRKKIIKKHEYNLSQIQFDINNTVKSLKTTREAKAFKSEISKYRSIERKFYRKYHISLRDLIRYGLVRDLNWTVRRIIVGHDAYRNRRDFGIKIYPGKKTWFRPNNNEENEENETGNETGNESGEESVEEQEQLELEGEDA
jgi:hypothetical protein